MPFIKASVGHSGKWLCQLTSSLVLSHTLSNALASLPLWHNIMLSWGTAVIVFVKHETKRPQISPADTWWVGEAKVWRAELVSKQQRKIFTCFKFNFQFRAKLSSTRVSFIDLTSGNKGWRSEKKREKFFIFKHKSRKGKKCRTESRRVFCRNKQKSEFHGCSHLQSVKLHSKLIE